ncbi:hypothetical protein V8G54_026431 [Vigna mungo]|uniref:WRKY domain-containing protein n=1 Tax=Vigna mungo TaxID=3915 RepID=A0AAQ3RN67_VIGMU
METQFSNGKKAMEEELMRGRDMANQLLDALGHDKLNTHLQDEGRSKSVLPFVEDLVRKVLCSFTNTLLLLNSNETTPSLSSSTNCPEMESLHETCKSRNILNTNNQRRCYKRKSIAPSWEKESSILIEDGYAWRKSYYRCTYKTDQRCSAMKQVQRIQDDPPLYRTTYYGHHTCRSPANPEIVLEPFSPSASSTLLSFDNSLHSKQENPFPSPLLASIKQEPQKVIHDEHGAQNQLSVLENLLLYDYDISFDYSRNVTLLSSAESVQLENVFGQFGF